MNFAAAEKIANAILYEGYILYPYRGSATKNQQRWNFGTLYPREYALAQKPASPYQFVSECLIQTDTGEGSAVTLDIRIRSLQLVQGNSSGHDTWQQGVERAREFNALPLRNLLGKTTTLTFLVGAGETDANSLALRGELAIVASVLRVGLIKLHLEFSNVTVSDANAIDRNQALLQAFTSAHAILGVDGGKFVSLLDPPAEMSQAVNTCQNAGVFPVLAGAEGERRIMLCSPIILYDYPQIAPESTGDFFDGTEMDEMLALRVLTLTDAEKIEMRQDEHSRKILERTESMPAEQLMKVHGAIRGLRRVQED